MKGEDALRLKRERKREREREREAELTVVCLVCLPFLLSLSLSLSLALALSISLSHLLAIPKISPVRFISGMVRPGDSSNEGIPDMRMMADGGQ